MCKSLRLGRRGLLDKLDLKRDLLVWQRRPTYIASPTLGQTWAVGFVFSFCANAVDVGWWILGLIVYKCCEVLIFVGLSSCYGRSLLVL